MDVVVGAELEAGVLRVAVPFHATSRTPERRGNLDELAARDVVDGQLALLLGESLPVLIPAVPANGDSMPAQDGALVHGKKAGVLLIRPVDAVPRVGGLAVAVSNAVETVENTAVMRRMDLGIVRQSIRHDSVPLRRIQMVEDLVRADATGRRGLVETLVMVRHDRPLAEAKRRVRAGVVVPGECVCIRLRDGGQDGLEPNRL